MGTFDIQVDYSAPFALLLDRAHLSWASPHLAEIDRGCCEVGNQSVHLRVRNLGRTVSSMEALAAFTRIGEDPADIRAALCIAADPMFEHSQLVFLGSPWCDRTTGVSYGLVLVLSESSRALHIADDSKAWGKRCEFATFTTKAP
jgi:hypothetical protein